MARMPFRLGFTRVAGFAACAAALSLAASPAMARGWYGPHYRYHHDHVSGGDILAGVLILGGIAAVASAASNSHRSDSDYRYSDPEPVYRPGAGYSGSYTGGGIDNAVDMCVNEVERGQERVSAVDNAARTTDGWKISGQLSAGSGFSCWIDNDGRIRNVDLGSAATAAAQAEDRPYDGSGPDNRPVWHGTDAGQSPDAAPAGSQWDDDSYARARAEVGYAGN
ncbi:MAG: hypothetical protein J7496_12140 [Novosphingobium sp.]|nr:hypothetical protein [Novosphingobium sp.]